MKAIVLSFDSYRAVADHMIHTYQAIWPTHPFTFRVPYQDDPAELRSKHAERIELVRVPPDIKRTVLGLLADLEDEEWIYWCIDDKYLIEIDEDRANHCYEWVLTLDDPTVQGVMFCRCRRLLEEENLRIEDVRSDSAGELYVARKNYHQFWIHQFMRVGVLRKLFSGFPDEPFAAKEMDAFTGQFPDLDVMEFDPDQKMYVSLRNQVRFGESTLRGTLLKNCYDSMTRYGIRAPAHLKRRSADIFMGEMEDTE